MSYYALTDTDWNWDDENEGRATVIKADTPEEAVRIATEKERVGNGGIAWKVCRLVMVGFELVGWDEGKEPEYGGFNYYPPGINGPPDLSVQQANLKRAAMQGGIVDMSKGLLGAAQESVAPHADDIAVGCFAVKTYRKTALVTAEQFLPAIGQIPKGVYSDGHGDPRKRPDCNWVLDTKEGRHTVRGGDYICTGPAGEQWNVASEIFEATYELAAIVPSPALEANQQVIETLRAALRKIAETPAWGAPHRWDETPFEVRQIARVALVDAATLTPEVKA